jgi:hypothetical protein
MISQWSVKTGSFGINSNAVFFPLTREVRSTRQLFCRFFFFSFSILAGRVHRHGRGDLLPHPHIELLFSHLQLHHLLCAPFFHHLPSFFSPSVFSLVCCSYIIFFWCLPSVPARIGITLVTIRNLLIAYGGLSSAGPSREIRILNSQDFSVWRQFLRMCFLFSSSVSHLIFLVLSAQTPPVSRSFGAGGVVAGSLFFVGGNTTNTFGVPGPDEYILKRLSFFPSPSISRLFLRSVPASFSSFPSCEFQPLSFLLSV